MEDDRLIAAFGRLDRALGRVEQRGLTQGGSAAAADAALAERHTRLRAATAEAIAEIDRLIGDR